MSLLLIRRDRQPFQSAPRNHDTPGIADIHRDIACTEFTRRTVFRGVAAFLLPTATSRLTHSAIAVEIRNDAGFWCQRRGRLTEDLDVVRLSGSKGGLMTVSVREARLAALFLLLSIGTALAQPGFRVLPGQ